MKETLSVCFFLFHSEIKYEKISLNKIGEKRATASSLLS